MSDGGSQPAMQYGDRNIGAGYARPRRNPNAPVTGSRSFIRWYERLGSGVALALVITVTGVVLAVSLIIIIGIMMVFLGNAMS